MSAQPWHAEVALDRELALELASTLLPEIAGLPFERAGSGWDVDVWRAGEVAFRFPRRAMGARSVENELSVLPLLRGRLPLRIPQPLAVGAATAGFPFRYWAHEFVPGIPLERAALEPEERAALAEPLAAVLRALHAVPADVARASGARADEIRRDIRVVAERAVARLPLLARAPWARLVPELEKLLAAPPADAGEPRWLIHGDVYCRHLLIDPSTRALAALIDWGDVCLGERAVDLAASFLTLPPRAREAFFRAYGEVDAGTRRLARFFAIARHGIQVLAYALDLGDTALQHEAGFSLENALAAE